MNENFSYHLIGVGGVGMSALAQLLLDLGHRVSGSDRFIDQGMTVPVLDILRRAGAVLHPQDGSALKHSRTVVAVSTAIEEDNRDLQRARQLGCRILHRAELLAEVLRGRRLVAVTGTSGKTTVTAMIGWTLLKMGFDPTVVNGGAVVGWGTDCRVGGVRLGRSDWCVVEADESDKSLMYFQPNWAVITNISKDHFDEAEAFQLFRQFAQRANEGVVVGPGAHDLARTLSPGTVAAPFEPVCEAGAWGFMFDGRRVPAPGLGKHNAENAAVAACVVLQLGVTAEAIVQALNTFPGVERRLQVVGYPRGITILDDYAHNPAKIRAAWSAVAERFARIWGVWRPHGFAPLRNTLNELAETFADVCRPEDHLFLLPVYYAGGTAQRDVSSDDLACRVRERGASVEVVPTYSVIEERVRVHARPGDAVLCMGARDPELPQFARLLAKVLKT